MRHSHGRDKQLLPDVLYRRQLLVGPADRDSLFERQPRQLDPKVASKIIVGSVAWAISGVAVVGRLAAKWSTSRISFIAAAGFAATVILLVCSMVLS